MEAIQYRGYTIEYMKGYDQPYMFYPTDAGIQHDEDFDGVSYSYTGNCRWADSIEEAKDMINDLDPVTNKEWKIV